MNTRRIIPARAPAPVLKRGEQIVDAPDPIRDAITRALPDLSKGFFEMTDSERFIVDLEPDLDEPTGKFFIKSESTGLRMFAESFDTEDGAWQAIRSIKPL